MISKRLAWAIAAIVLCGVMASLSYAYPSAGGGAYLELLGLLVCAGYLRHVHRFSAQYVYTAFYQIYSLIGIAVSLIFIGAGTPMLEIGKVGDANGATWISLLFLVLGLEAGRLGFILVRIDRIVKTRKLESNANEILVYTLTSFVLAVGLFILAKFGSPILLGVTRVNFWNEIVPNIFRLYPSLLGQTFLLGAFIYLDRSQRKVPNGKALLIVLLYILVTIVVAGEKFSTFVLYITVFLVLYAGFYGRPVAFRKIITISGMLAIFMFTLVAASYATSDRDALFIVYRIAMQGQLLWSVFSESVEILMLGDDQACLMNCGADETGSEYISAKYLPAGLWDSYVATGSGLSGFMPAIPILSFGLPMAIFLHFLISMLLGGVQRFLVENARCKDLVMTLLLFKIYFGLLVFWYASKVSALPGVVATSGVLLLWIIIFRWRSPSRSQQRLILNDPKCPQ